MKELINDPFVQMIIGIIVSAALSIYLTLKFSSRKSILFEINNVFQLSDNRLSAFKRLDITVNGNRILEEKSKIFLVEFEFINNGNKDIRFVKDDGQFLKLILDKQFEIIDINDDIAASLDIEKNLININIQSFKSDSTISIVAILRQISQENDPQKEKVGRIVLSHTRLHHDIIDLKKIKTERIFKFAILSVLQLSISFFFLYLGSLLIFNNGLLEVKFDELVSGLFMTLIGVIVARDYFEQHKHIYKFHKRQNK